jgi:hypothetical protein
MRGEFIPIPVENQELSGLVGHWGSVGHARRSREAGYSAFPLKYALNISLSWSRPPSAIVELEPLPLSSLVRWLPLGLKAHLGCVLSHRDPVLTLSDSTLSGRFCIRSHLPEHRGWSRALRPTPSNGAVRRVLGIFLAKTFGRRMTDE